MDCFQAVEDKMWWNYYQLPMRRASPPIAGVSEVKLSCFSSGLLCSGGCRPERLLDGLSHCGWLCRDQCRWNPYEVVWALATQIWSDEGLELWSWKLEGRKGCGMTRLFDMKRCLRDFFKSYRVLFLGCFACFPGITSLTWPMNRFKYCISYLSPFVYACVRWTDFGMIYTYKII